MQMLPDELGRGPQVAAVAVMHPAGGGAPVRAVVFSRDRAMQLDALLRSLAAHCAEADGLRVDVLFTASSAGLARQYGEVERTSRGPLDLRLVREQDFRADLLRIVAGANEGAESASHLLFLVDDALFCRTFSMRRALAVLAERPRALGFSLRLGAGLTSCYALGVAQSVPHLEPLGGGVVAFDWTTAEGDFAYPLEVSSSIYERRRIAQLLRGLDFADPNTLEARLAATAGARLSRSAPELLCFARPVAFSAAVNRVQTVFANRAGSDPRLSVAELARLFRQGLRIDTRAFEGFAPGACHCEVPFAFVRRDDEARAREPRRQG
jgi:hypothetical protein